MEFNRLDILEAHFLFLCHFNEGQGSNKYQRLEKMLKRFTPALSLNFSNLSETGQRIYCDLFQAETGEILLAS